MDGGSWHCTGDREQNRPQEKEMQKKAKRLSQEALQIAVKRIEAKSKWGNERYTHLNAEFQRIARRDKKAFLSDQCKEIEENNWMGKTRDLCKKIKDTKGKYHAKMGTIKSRNSMDLKEAKDIKKRWQEYTEREVAQSCPTLSDPMDCSLPGSSVHGIFQAIVLEWIAISFSKESSQPRDQTWVSHIVDRRFTACDLSQKA